MSESELYAPVRTFFQARGFTVRGEVRNCDVVAVRGEFIAIIEMKKSFNIEVVYQALERASYGHECYIAVPEPTSRRRRGRFQTPTSSAENLCRRLGLGLLVVRDGVAHLMQAPGDAIGRPTFNRARGARLMHEFSRRTGDHNVGGTTRVRRVTAYQEDCLRLAVLCSQAETREITPADGRAAGISNAAAILRDNHYAWFRRVSFGRFTLTIAGEAAMVEYAHVIAPVATETEAAS